VVALKKAKKRKRIDWEPIEKEIRLSQKSLRTIAKQYKITAGAISKRMKSRNIVRDKSEEVRKRTNAALITIGNKNGNTDGNTPTESDIDNVVKANIEIITGHRKQIAKGRQITELLFNQLHEAAENRIEIEDDITADTTGDGEGNTKGSYQRRLRMLKAVSLPGHASTMRDLSQALKNLIPLERIAFNLDAADNGDDDLDLKLSDNDKKIFKQAARIISQRVIENATEDD
jgi:hypothetical protein